MKPPFRLLAVLLTSINPASLNAQASPVTLSLVGQGGTARTLSFADLQALPQIDVLVVNKDSSRTTFRGPTLRSSMTLVDAPTGHPLRGPSMLLAVVAEAADSWMAYMVAEIDVL